MNKIYQVLWSKTRHMYVVVSEIATRNTKAPGTKTLLGARLAAAALVLAVGIGQGLAYAEDKTVDIGNGGTATYTEKGNVVIGKDNTVPNDGAGKNVVTGTGNSAQHVDGTGNAQKFLPDDPKLVDDNNGNPSPVETPGNTKGLDSAVISGNGASAEADGDTSIGKGANITNPLVPYYADENGNATSDPNAAAYFYQNGKLVKGTDGLKYATGATDADGNPVVTDDPYYKHTYETTVTILHPDGTIERKKLDPMTVINQDPSASPTSYNTTKDDEGNIITTKVKETETPTRNLADGYSYYSQSFYDPSTDSLAAGTDATVTGKDAVAAGHDSQAAGNSVAVGNKASSEEGGTAVGPAAAAGTGAVATGIGANADNFGVASGASSNAGENAVAVGDGSYAGDSSQAIGSGSQATVVSTAVGTGSQATLISTAVGNGSKATGAGSAALGNNSSATADGGVALGNDSVANRGAENYGWDPVTKSQATAEDKGTDPVWYSNRGAVSVGISNPDGTPKETRQITNVAAGTNDGDAVNVAQLKSAVAAAETHYYSWNDKDDHQPNYKNDGATGNRALAAGVGAAATGDGATSVGNYTNASGETSIAIGGTKLNADGTISYVQTPKMVQKTDPDTGVGIVDDNGDPVMVEAKDDDGNTIYVNKLDDNGNPIPYNTKATGENSIAVGTNAVSYGNDGVAIGTDTGASTHASAYGYKATAWGDSSTAVGAETGAGNRASAYGYKANAYGDDSTAIGSQSGAGNSGTTVGTNAGTYDTNGTAVGKSAWAGNNGTAVGLGTAASGTDTTAVGSGTKATGQYTSAMGFQSGSSGSDTSAFGFQTNATNSQTSAFGFQTGASGGNTSAFGFQTHSSGSNTSAFGFQTSASGSNSSAFGFQANASGSNSTSVGYNSGASASNGTAVGFYAKANSGSGNGGPTSVGFYSNANGEGSTSVGYYSNSGYQATAVGYYANATYQSATAVGHALANSYSATGVGDGAKANGTQSTAVGYSTNAGYEATAVGYYANASDSYATAVGYNANANSSNSTAVGHAYASSSNATAVGESAYATSSSDTAVGNWTHASGSYSTAIGNSAAASSYESTAAGYNAHASNSYATAIGNSASASSQYSTAVGYASASNDYATAVGHSANAHGYQGTALGYNANASGYQASALGYSANASGSSATAVGYGSGASGSNTTAIGYGAGATDGQTTAIGYQASSSGGNTLAVGFQAGATGGQTTSIGYHTSASGSNTTAIGYKSAATDDSTTAIGNQAKASNQYSTAIGYNNQAVAQSATAIGNASNAWGTNAVAISTSAGAGNDAVAIGNAAGAYGDDSVAISSGASAGKYAVSVGKNANAWKEDSIVFGYNSKSGSDHGIMGWDPLSANIGQDYTTPTWTSTNNAVSFGRAEERDADGNVTLTQITRQINNVAAGTLDTDVVNVAQLKSAIKSFEYNAGKWHDYDVNVPTEEITADTNYDNTGAQKGKRAMAAGFSATANGDDSMALGFATANGVESVAIGKGAVVDGVKAVGFGDNKSIGLSSMAFGQGNTAGKPADENGAYTLQYNGTDKKETVMADADMHEAYTDGGKTFNVTFKTEDKADQHLLVLRTKDNTPVVLASDGKLYNVSWDNDSNSYVQGDEATGLTTANLVTHAYGTDGATFVGAYSTAFGHGNTASGTASLAFGGEPISIKKDRIYTNTASGKNSVAFGAGTVASGQDTVAFGDGSTASNDEAVAFGQRTTASAARATAFGESSTASGQTATAFGYHTTASGTGATALGNKSQASGMYAMAWGGGDRHVKDAQGNELKDDQGNPVKLGPVASGTYSTAFGSGTQATAENATAFGELSNATGKNSTAFGKESTASGENTLAALGGTAEGANSTAIGVGATAKLDGSIALGDGAVANTAAGKVGYDALGTGYVSTDQSAAWKSTKNALSVGDVDNKVTRQITGLAAGSEDTDAVNVAQLKRVTTLAEQHTLVTVNQTKTEAPKDATTGKYTDEYDTENGNLNIRASTGENGQNTFNIKLNDQIGLGQKGEPGTPGKDGVDGKVTVTQKDGTTIIIGKDGEDGAPGLTIKGPKGEDGTDGKDAVAINGKDGIGTIGLAGKDGTKGTDGKDGISTTTIRTEYVHEPGVNGENGKDGKPGETRIIYKDPDNKDHTVATLEDGLKFTGNNSSTINHNKLNTTVNVVGEGTGSDLTNFKSAGGNIAVEANGKNDNESTLTIKLNKDVNLGNTGSLTVGGDTNNTNPVVIKHYNDEELKDTKGGDVSGGDYITGLDNRTWNIDNPTYVSGRAATEDELKQAGDQINTKIENVKNSVTNVDAGGGFGLQDEHSGKVSQDLGTNIQIIGDGTRTYETKKDENGNPVKDENGNDVKVLKDVTDSNITTTVVDLEDGSKAVEVALSDHVNLGGKGKDGKDGVDGSIGINGADGKSGVGIDGKDGISMQGEAGKNGISIKGDPGLDGKPGQDGISIKGPQGDPGEPGNNGHIGITGKDGKDAVAINGTDGVGTIGLAGKDGTKGADGKDGIGITTIRTEYVTRPGVDGEDGKDGVTRIIYKDPEGGTHEIATLDDGLKFTGNNSDTVNHNKLDTTVHIVGEGTDKDLSKFKSAGGNIAVEANGGSDNASTLTIKLNKDVNLGGNGSLTVGGDGNVTRHNEDGSTTVVKNDPVVIKNYNEGELKDNKGNDVEKGDYITGLDNRTWNIDDPTYVSGRAATEDELKQAGDQINTKITNITDATKGGGFGLADDTGKKVSQDLGTNIQVIGDGDRIYKDDGKGGKVIDKVENSNITTEVVDLPDGSKAVQVALSDHVNLGGKGKDGKDGVDGSIGINGKDGKSGVGIDGKDGITMTGDAGKNGISIKGDDGKDGKDGISIKGPSGENGDNGHIGISGKDGKDAVALDGKDGVGHIGLKGEPGKDGKDATADITVHQGPVGVDGTDGKDGKDGMDRITYVDHNEVTHEVATLDDGLKFGANAASTNYTDNPVYNKLNSTVDIVGEGTKDESAYSGKNIKTFVKQDDGNTTITVKMDKDLYENTVTVGKDGKNGKDGVDGKVTVVQKDGSTVIIGKDGKDGKNGISIKGADGKDGISITGPTGEPGKDGNDGHIGIAGKDGKDAVGINGTDGIGTIGLAGKDGTKGADGKDGIGITTIRTEYVTKPGVDGEDGVTRIIYTDPDGKDHPVATTDDGMKFVGEDGTATPISKKLNETLQIRGDGTYDASTQKVTKQGNIITSVDQGTIKVELNKDLKDLNSVTSNTYYARDTTTDNYTTINKDGMTIKNGPTITKTNVDMNNQQIHHVAPGTEGTDAVNVNQLKGSINKVDNRINKAAAGAAALSALHPLDFDPDDKWDFAAGYGHYKDANAAAIGAFYRPNEDTMFSVGASMGNGENMINAGVSVKLGQGNHVSVSRVAMAKEIIELRKELENVKSYLADQAAGNTLDLSKIQLFPDTPENHWAYDYVATMAGNGVLEGYPDGYFKGNRNMTRYEMAAVLYRMMQNGAKLSERALREFAPELDRIRVDTITKDKRGVPDIQRVRTVKGRE